jgi:hypothetical protein
MGTSLSGTYHSTVNIGQGDISSTVTLTGYIAIGFYGDDGIYAAASVKNPIVYNEGSIVGGANGDKVEGGTGVYLASSGTVINAGSPNAGYGEIYGGTCSNNASGNGEGGGTGVDLGGGGLLGNYGIIGGGAGGSSTSHRGGAGGDGVFAEPTSNIVNHNRIYGGAGGKGGAAGGFGGDGVVLGGGSLVNYGVIRGGAGGTGGSASGGAGVFLLGGANLHNIGYITGGGVASNTIIYATGDSGGTGLDGFAAGLISNYGSIAGGIGSATPTGTACAGGIGVYLTAGTCLANNGFIAGGLGGNSGALSSYNGTGGAGGAGLIANGSTGVIDNAFEIAGGVGGYSLDGGAGGIGVMLNGGDMLINTGRIYGGAGGYGLGTNGVGGAGGIGVYLNGGTLVNSGIIAGGKSGEAATEGATGISLVFGKTASTLVLDPGSSIAGGATANAAASDVLDLAGTAAGTLVGLGASGYIGFNTVNVESGANWTDIANFSTATAGSTLTLDGKLTIDHYFRDAGSVNLAGGGGLLEASGGIVNLTNFALAAGTLSVASNAIFIVGGTANADGEETGAVSIDYGTTFDAFGVIEGGLAGEGTADVTEGSLAITGTVYDTVIVSVAKGAIADFSGGGTFGAIGGEGLLQLDGTSAFTMVSGTTQLGIANVLIDPKAILSGTGFITGTLVNSKGVVSAAGGTLMLEGKTSGNGSFAASGTGTLDFASGVTTTGVISGTGTIRFNGASTLNTGAKITASHVVDTANITLSTGENLTEAAKHTFVMAPASGGTITLAGATGDSFSNAGTLTGKGPGAADVNTAFINSATVSAAGGTLAFLGSVSNTGTMSSSGGTLSIATQVSGSGTLLIGTAGAVLLQDGVVAAQTVEFKGTTGLLDLSEISNFAASITDFGAKDRIDLLNTKITGFTFAGGDLTLKDGTTQLGVLSFVGPYTQSDFATASDGHSGTVITFK